MGALTAKEIEERIERLGRCGDTGRACVTHEIERVAAYIEGKQNLYWNGTDLAIRKYEADEGKAVFNWVGDMARSLEALFLDAELQAECRAKSSDQNSRSKAKAGLRVFDHVWRTIFYRKQLLRHFIDEAVVAGKAVWRLDWDPWKGEVRPAAETDQGRMVTETIPDENGVGEETMVETNAPEGRIDARIVRIDELDLDYEGAECMDQVHELVHHYYVPEHEFKNKFPKAKVKFENISQESRSDGGGEAGEKHVEVWEYFRRPDSDHHQGLHVVMAGAGTGNKNVVQRDDALEYWPFVEIEIIHRRKHFWGQSPLINVLDQQLLFNQAANGVERSRTLYGRPWVTDRTKTSGDSRGRLIMRAGAILPSSHTIVPAPDMPGWIVTWTDRLLDWGKRFGGVTDALTGERASAAASGRLQMALEAQSLRVHRGAAQSYEACICETGTIVLYLMKDRAPHPLVISVMGPSQRMAIESIEDNEWDDGVITIEAGSGMPRNKAILDQVITEQVGMGIWQDRTPRQIRAMLSTPTGQEERDHDEMMRSYVQRQIRLMSKNIDYVWDVERYRDAIDPEIANEELRYYVIGEDFDDLDSGAQDKVLMVLKQVGVLYAEYQGQFQPTGGPQQQQPPAPALPGAENLPPEAGMAPGEQPLGGVESQGVSGLAEAQMGFVGPA